MADDVKQSREEFQEARRALVDMLVAQNPGTTHQMGDGVAIADLASHFQNAAAQAANADREAAARFLGISVDELDARKAQEAGPAGSTPEQRAANLPAGKAPAPQNLPPKLQPEGAAPAQTQDWKSPIDRMADAAREFLNDSRDKWGG